MCYDKRDQYTREQEPDTGIITIDKKNHFICESCWPLWEPDDMIPVGHEQTIIFQIDGGLEYKTFENWGRKMYDWIRNKIELFPGIKSCRWVLTTIKKSRECRHETKSWFDAPRIKNDDDNDDKQDKERDYYLSPVYDSDDVLEELEESIKGKLFYCWDEDDADKRPKHWFTLHSREDRLYGAAYSAADNVSRAMVKALNGKCKVTTMAAVVNVLHIDMRERCGTLNIDYAILKLILVYAFPEYVCLYRAEYGGGDQPMTLFDHIRLAMINSAITKGCRTEGYVKKVTIEMCNNASHTAKRNATGDIDAETDEPVSKRCRSV